MATVVAGNQTVVSPNAVPVQIISSTGQVVSQGVVQSAAQQQQQHQQQQQQHQQQHQQQQQQNVIAAVQPIQAAPKPKTHFCASCGKGFAAKHGLMQHNRRHPSGSCTLRTHVCECGKAFFQKNHLMLHQRQHLETKPTPQQLAQSANNQQDQLAQQQQSQQNAQLASQQQQAQQSQAQQHTMTREVLIGNQPVHVQVLQGTNTAQVIKYEINIPQDGQNLE